MVGPTFVLHPALKPLVRALESHVSEGTGAPCFYVADLRSSAPAAALATTGADSIIADIMDVKLSFATWHITVEVVFNVVEVEEAPDLILRVHTSSRLKALLRYDDIPEMTTWTTQKHPHALLHIFLRLRMVLQARFDTLVRAMGNDRVTADLAALRTLKHRETVWVPGTTQRPAMAVVLAPLAVPIAHDTTFNGYILFRYTVDAHAGPGAMPTMTQELHMDDAWRQKIDPNKLPVWAPDTCDAMRFVQDVASYISAKFKKRRFKPGADKAFMTRLATSFQSALVEWDARAYRYASFLVDSHLVHVSLTDKFPSAAPELTITPIYPFFSTASAARQEERRFSVKCPYNANWQEEELFEMIRSCLKKWTSGNGLDLQIPTITRFS